MHIFNNLISWWYKRGGFLSENEKPPPPPGGEYLVVSMTVYMGRLRPKVVSSLVFTDPYLPIMAISPQRPLSSVPKAAIVRAGAIVERFDYRLNHPSK